jgi:hypothetical protein
MDTLERRYHKRQLESADAELERVKEKLALAQREIADDDKAATEETRMHLADALAGVAQARDCLEDALTCLPRPVYDAVEGHWH